MGEAGEFLSGYIPWYCRHFKSTEESQFPDMNRHLTMF